MWQLAARRTRIPKLIVLLLFLLTATLGADTIASRRPGPAKTPPERAKSTPKRQARTKSPQARRANGATNQLPPSAVVRRRVHHAMQLATRGAVYAAEEEFLQTLQLMAHRCDESSRDETHGDALAAGLLALKEADAFAVALDDASASRNVRALMAAHTTPVLKKSSRRAIPALLALQAYYEYAQAKLRYAVELDPDATEVFYGLAKVSMAQAGREAETAAIAQAIAYLQLALDANPNNYRAANELGVLLARCGRLQQAKHVLRQALSTREEAEVLLNLSKVHARLGESDLSVSAKRQYERVRQRRSNSGRANPMTAIRWVEKSTFSEVCDDAELISQAPARKMSTKIVAKTEVDKNPPPTKTKGESALSKVSSLFRLPRRSHQKDAPQPRVSRARQSRVFE